MYYHLIIDDLTWSHIMSNIFAWELLEYLIETLVLIVYLSCICYHDHFVIFTRSTIKEYLTDTFVQPMPLSCDNSASWCVSIYWWNTLDLSIWSIGRSFCCFVSIDSVHVFCYTCCEEFKLENRTIMRILQLFPIMKWYSWGAMSMRIFTKQKNQSFIVLFIFYVQSNVFQKRNTVLSRNDVIECHCCSAC